MPSHSVSASRALLPPIVAHARSRTSSSDSNPLVQILSVTEQDRTRSSSSSELCAIQEVVAGVAASPTVIDSTVPENIVETTEPPSQTIPSVEISATIQPPSKSDITVTIPAVVSISADEELAHAYLKLDLPRFDLFPLIAERLLMRDIVPVAPTMAQKSSIAIAPVVNPVTKTTQNAWHGEKSSAAAQLLQRMNTEAIKSSATKSEALLDSIVGGGNMRLLLNLILSLHTIYSAASVM